MKEVTDPTILAHFGIPRPELVDALIQQESGGNNAAVSPKGARGLAQVMPKTARDPGFGVKPLADNSPQEQRRFATDYLGAMLKKYNGDERLALAAYNAGPRAVDAHKGIPPFPETKNYVSQILGALNPISSASADETPYVDTSKLKEVTDPKILAELNSSQSMKEVTDPKILAELNSSQTMQAEPDQGGSPLGFTLNSVNKGIAGVADNILNTPQNAYNLLKAGAGMAFYDPKDAPEVTIPENTVQNFMRNNGMIRGEYDPTSQGGRVADYVIQSMTGAGLSPGSLARNLTAGAVGGVAGGSVQEVTKSPIAGIAASVIAPSASGAGRIGAQKLLDRNKITNTGVNNMAADRFIEASGKDRQTLIQMLANQKDIIKGSQQTSAQALKNSGLASMQRTYQTMPGRLDENTSIPEAFTNRYAEQQAAQAALANKAIPAQNGAEKFKTQVQGDVNQINAANSLNAQNATNAIASNATPEYMGGVVRGVVGGRHADAKAATKAAYEAIDPNNESRVSIPLDKLEAVIKARHPLADDELPPAVKQLMAIAGNQPSQVPLSIISALRAKASQEVHKAGLTGDVHAAGTLGEMKRILTDVPEMAAEAGVIPPDMANRVRYAVALRKNQGDTFETGATNNLIRKGINNTTKLEDAQVMRNFLNGSPDDVKRFVTAIGGDSAAMAAAESHIKGEFDNALFTPSGELKKNFGDAYAKFNAQYRPVLNQFPQLKARIDQAMKLQGQAAETKAKLESGGVRHFLNDKDAPKQVKSLLSSATKEKDIGDIGTLISSDKDKKANLAGGIKDVYLNKTLQKGASDVLGNQRWNQADALQFLKSPDNRKLADMLLNRKQKAQLTRLQQDLESVQFAKNAALSQGSPTAANLANSSFSTALLGKIPGGGALKFAIQATEKIGDEKLKATFARMLLDPKYAEKALKNMSPTSRERLADAFITNLGIYGQTIPHVGDK